MIDQLFFIAVLNILVIFWFKGLDNRGFTLLI